MFQSQKRQTRYYKIKNALWPDMGWVRFTKYYIHRLGRLSGSTGFIASGFAYGAALSFTPYLGFHIVIAAVFCRLTSGSMIAAALGTLVGNPWTFPFIWLSVYHVGRKMLNMVGWTTQTIDLSFANLSFDMLMDNFDDIFIPMMVGSIPHGVVAWFIFYYLIKYFLDKRQAKRLAAKKLKQQTA